MGELREEAIFYILNSQSSKSEDEIVDELIRRGIIKETDKEIVDCHLENLVKQNFIIQSNKSGLRTYMHRDETVSKEYETRQAYVNSQVEFLQSLSKRFESKR